MYYTHSLFVLRPKREWDGAVLLFQKHKITRHPQAIKGGAQRSKSDF
jgi:hypothetical protein